MEEKKVEGLLWRVDSGISKDDGRKERLGRVLKLMFFS